MSKDSDVQIEKKETELSFFLQCMEELKCEFIKETIHFASEWYKKTAKEYVTKYPEVTLSLKEPQIALMKTQVNRLIGDTEKTVQSELVILPCGGIKNSACTNLSSFICKLLINTLKSLTAPSDMC